MLRPLLVDHGAQLTITGRNEEKLADAAASLGPNVTSTAGDVRESEDVQRQLDHHLGAYGKVDFLINNAAGNFLCPLEKMSENAFNSVLRIVTMGSFLWSKSVFPHMKEQGAGRIVNIGTTYSWNQASYVAHSGAAKAAVLNLTRTMAVEWGPHGIRANVIAPGPVKGTEGVRRLFPEGPVRDQYFGMMPVKRMAEGWEIAAMALYLVSPLGDYINGAAIPVDGGSCLGIPGLLPVGMDLGF